MNWLLVIVGGALGAPLRYLTDRAVQLRHDSLFPWGTFAVNTVGCVLLGALTGALLAGAVPARLGLLLGTGLCGVSGQRSLQEACPLRGKGSWAH